MGQQIEHRRVRLADLVCCGGRPIARRRGESQERMRARLLSMDGLLARGRRKAAAYARAMARGEVFPPAFVIALDGQLMLDDGCHRCGAAVMRGERSIQAVVIPVATYRQADAVSELLFNLERAGASWPERARIVVAMVC